MKTLTNLTGKCEDTAYLEPGVYHHIVGRELGKGRFILARLGPSGLVVTNGKDSVAFPMDELLSAAAAVEPGLEPPKPDGPGPLTEVVAPKAP
jgi:hypothetical protein